MPIISLPTTSIFTASEACELLKLDAMLAELVARFSQEQPEAIVTSVTHSLAVLPAQKPFSPPLVLVSLILLFQPAPPQLP